MDEPGGAVLVAGLGNELRHDDAAGLLAARILRERAAVPGIEVHELAGEPLELLDAAAGYHALVVIDTMRSGAPPGSLRRLEVTNGRLPSAIPGTASTHAIGLAEAIELGSALGRLPDRIVVHAVEGMRFDTGAGLTPEVATALADLAERAWRDAVALGRKSRSPTEHTG